MAEDRLIYLFLTGIEELKQKSKKDLQKKKVLARKAEELKEKISSYKENKILLDNL